MSTSTEISALSNDFNTRTAQRALNAAKEYLDKQMASNARRDLDRAKSTLAKVPVEDRPYLDQLCQTLGVEIERLEASEVVRRVMTGVERYTRYAREAVDKNNAGEAQRNIASARREVAKLPDELQAEQNALLDALAAEAEAAEEKAKAAARLRQLDRELRSARETIARNSQITPAGVDDALNRPRATLAQLPAVLQPEWQAAIDAIVAAATGQHLPAPAAPPTPTPPVAASAPPATSAPPVSAPDTTARPAEELPANVKRSVERALRSVLEELRSQNPDRARYNAERAHTEIETKVPEALRAPFLAQLAEAQVQVDEAMRQMRAQNLLRAVERRFGACTSLLEDTPRHSGDIASQIDHQLAQAEEMLTRDGECLSEAAMGEVRARFPELRAAAELARARYLGKQAAKYLERFEGSLSGEIEVRFREEIDGYHDNASRALADVPDSFEGRADLVARLAAAEQRKAAQRASEDKARTVEAVHELWRGLQANTRFDGFATEPGSDYATWRASGQLGLPLTQAAIRTANDLLASEQVAVARDAGFDTDIAVTVDEALEVRRLGLEKLASTAGAIVTGADHSDRPAELAKSLRQLGDELKRSGDPDELLAPVTRTIGDTASAIERSLEARAAELQRAREAGEQAATALWPAVLAGCEVAELDPSAALADATAWRGKLVRFENRQNRMGWDFEIQGNHFITRIRGIAVAARLTPALSTALQEMQHAIGFERDGQEFDDLLIELDGSCRVQPIRWNHEKDRWDYLGAEEGVYGHIVAFRSGPFAAAANGARSVE